MGFAGVRGMAIYMRGLGHTTVLLSGHGVLKISDVL